MARKHSANRIDRDPVMDRVSILFKRSGLTLEALGCLMNSGDRNVETARKSAWQFLNKTNDPRLSTLRRFALALGVPLGELIVGDTDNDERTR